ncbi:MAG TPA: hypothetical protein VFQ61_29270 [Polyangiaceae bacterium]|nr:hypothetical protein [Polyangiaceae bacterium]
MRTRVVAYGTAWVWVLCRETRDRKEWRRGGDAKFGAGKVVVSSGGTGRSSSEDEVSANGVEMGYSGARVGGLQLARMCECLREEKGSPAKSDREWRRIPTGEAGCE